MLGESADLLWAPMSYLLIDAMYHDSSPWAGVSFFKAWTTGLSVCNQAFCVQQ